MKKGFSNVEGVGKYNFIDGVVPLENAKQALVDASAKVDAITAQLLELDASINGLVPPPVMAVQAYKAYQLQLANLANIKAQLTSQLNAAVTVAKAAQVNYNSALQQQTQGAPASGFTPAPTTPAASTAPTSATATSFLSSTSGIVTISVVSLIVLGITVKLILK